MTKRLDFNTDPSRYRHWRLEVDMPIARLTLDVDEDAGVFDGYELKLNSYDIGVDIELADAIQRLRFEHPDVGAVLITSGKDNTFCAGANIRMLAGATHVHKVNFCKFTNETRNAMEDASANSGQRYVAAVNGTAAGGGYELALAAEKILLIDDGSAAVSLPEVPLLAVLPGTGGLTRIVDKRKVRRDIADQFSTLEEGFRGERAVKARLVDEAIPRSGFIERCEAVLSDSVIESPVPIAPVELTPLDKVIDVDAIRYSSVDVEIDRSSRTATITLSGPRHPCPGDIDGILEQGADFWPLTVFREFDDALLEVRFNEPEIGTLFLKTRGDPATVAEYDASLESIEHSFIREVNLLGQRVFKRLDLTSRSLFALIEPGSCFTGFLAELAFAADQGFMLEGAFEDRANEPPATLTLSAANFGRFQMVNGLSRLAVRFLGEPESLDAARASTGRPLDAQDAFDGGLITTALDDLDWEDEIRLLAEERAGFSPDALTGMEANLRFAGPETMESKIFARLTAWQNWIFQRPNAVGPEGALPLFGSGRRPNFDKQRT